MRRLVMMTVFGALLVAAPAQAELLVKISKSQQRLAVVVNGAEAFRWPVSTGRRGYTTPSGTYRPTRLERHWYSRKYQMSPMPWSVFFHRGYAVHGTMEAYNLGHPASHGCVRLRPDNASILFSMVKRYGARHTRLVVMDGPLPNVPHPGTPMVEAPDAARLAKAEAKDDEAPAIGKPVALAVAQSEHLSAKAHTAVNARDVEPAAKPVVRVRVANLEQLSRSVGSEAQVLRERDAWLKAIDRKYGIAH